MFRDAIKNKGIWCLSPEDITEKDEKIVASVPSQLISTLAEPATTLQI